MMRDVSGKKNYEIVVFSDDWNGLPFSCKHLLRHFLPETPLIWVETIGLRSPGFNLYDIKRAFQKILGWLSRPNGGEKKALQANLRLLDPFQLPYNQHEFIRRINRKKMIGSIRELTKNDSPKYRIMLTTWPFLGDLIGNLDEQLSIYYRVDDFSEFPGVRKEVIARQEEEIMDKADIIVASAENLAKLKNNKKAVKYLPHGVDFEHFASKKLQDSQPSLFHEIPSPKIGFFGLLNSWLDFDLVWKVAKKRPDWSFIFLGPSQLPESELPTAPNMHFPGPVDYENLPAYASHFDASIIPFKINKLTISVNPLKLMEYFALGLPVVSTPLPEVVKYSKYAYIGSKPDTFEEAIEKALLENNPDLKRQRLNIAKLHGWKEKSQELRNWIEEALEKKVGA